MAYLYDLFNIKQNRMVACNIPSSEVSDKTGIPITKVANYAIRGITYARKYKVFIAGQTELQASNGTRDSYTAEEQEVMRQWDLDMRPAAKLLASGKGKIVYINDKPSHVVLKK